MPFDPEADSVAQASESLARELRDRVRFAVHDAQPSYTTSRDSTNSG
jgi:hypothetical protein